MATFYGQVTGKSDTIATRTGTKNSGIRASVQSWEGSIITELNYNQDGELMVNLSTAKDSRGSWGDDKFYGTFEKFNELTSLVAALGTSNSIKLLQKELKKRS